MTRIEVTGGPTAPRSALLTTVPLAPKDRFPFWRETICSYLSPSDTTRPAFDEAFHASLRRVVVGRVNVCDIEFSPLRSVRDVKYLKRMPDDDIFVAQVKRGEGRLLQDRRSATPTTGDVVVYDSARTFDWSFERETRMVIARIPRRQMVARLPEVERLTARVIRAAHPLASIIGTTLSEVTRFDESLSEERVQRFGGPLIDIVATSLEAGLADARGNAADADLIRRAKAYLIENIEDPGVDLAQLTSHLGVSLRSLCRAFASDGTTAIRWLWQQRLDLAYRLLAERQVRNVSQVAMQCGFSDFSHFSRAFKKTYGVMPKSVRRDAAHPD